MVPARKLVTLNYGRALKADTRSPGKVPVFGTNGQCGWHDAPLAKAPGLILGRKGQGPLGVEWCDKDFWVIDTAYYASTLTPDVDLKYLYHLVKYVGLNHLKDGTSNPTLSRDTFGAQLFPLPPLAEQKAIAAVLGALDDKIELNRRMNATLEAMARALFQSWFVDFDPVRAKLDGRPPAALDPATAAFFPDSFQDSALGEIPYGWRLGTLGELVQLRTDRVDATPAKDNIRYIALEDMPAKSIDLSNFQLGSAVNSSITAFRKGDVLFGSMRPYFHKVGLAFFDGITRTTTFVLRPRKDCFRHFALLHFYSDDVVAHSTTASVGTTIPYVRWDSMESYRIPVPPDSLLGAFEKTVSPLVQRIAAQGEESRTLATLRDTLLPKLLSGELSVENLQN
jgi:type I restriction enzyme S subunit